MQQNHPQSGINGQKTEMTIIGKSFLQDGEAFGCSENDSTKSLPTRENISRHKVSKHEKMSILTKQTGHFNW